MCFLLGTGQHEIELDRSRKYVFPTYKDATIEDEHHNLEKAGATHLGVFFCLFHTVEKIRAENSLLVELITKLSYNWSHFLIYLLGDFG